MPVVARRVQEEDGPSYTILREIPATGPSSFKESPTPPRGNCWWPLECSMLCVLWKARTTSLPPRPPARHSHVTGRMGRRRHRHTQPFGRHETHGHAPTCAEEQGYPVVRRKATQGKAWAAAATVHLSTSRPRLQTSLPSLSALRSSSPPPAHANHPHGERPPRIIARRRSERVSRWHPRGSAFVGGGGRPRQPRSARRR